jgi:hypothetical protein
MCVCVCVCVCARARARVLNFPRQQTSKSSRAEVSVTNSVSIARLMWKSRHITSPWGWRWNCSPKRLSLLSNSREYLSEKTSSQNISMNLNLMFSVSIPQNSSICGDGYIAFCEISYACSNSQYYCLLGSDAVWSGKYFTLFGGTYFFYCQASTLKLEAVSSSEILKYFSRSTLYKTTICKMYVVHETAAYRNPNICTVLLETEKLVRSLIDQQLNMLCFFENVRKSNFCRHNIFTEGLFVTQLSSNEGTAVWRTACVTTNCCLMLVIFQSPSRRRFFSLADLPGLSRIIQ